MFLLIWADPMRAVTQILKAMADGNHTAILASPFKFGANSHPRNTVYRTKRGKTKLWIIIDDRRRYPKGANYRQEVLRETYLRLMAPRRSLRCPLWSGGLNGMVYFLPLFCNSSRTQCSFFFPLTLVVFLSMVLFAHMINRVIQILNYLPLNI